MIVIDMFIKKWDIRYCTQIFDIFTRKFFEVHFIKGRSFFTRLRNYFRCWFNDGCYDVVILKDFFKNVFDVDQRMFDINKQCVFECKITMTATTLSNASTYLFINYNDDELKIRNCNQWKLSSVKNLIRLTLNRI